MSQLVGITMGNKTYAEWKGEQAHSKGRPPAVTVHDKPYLQIENVNWSAGNTLQALDC